MRPSFRRVIVVLASVMLGGVLAAQALPPAGTVVPRAEAAGFLAHSHAWIHPLDGPVRRMPVRDARVFGKKDITTQLVPLTAFYEAEAYHQDFAAHNPYNPYIMMWDRPKVDALKKQFPQLYVK